MHWRVLTLRLLDHFTDDGRKLEQFQLRLRKFRCIRSTPTEMQSMSENDFECLARTGVNAPGQCL